jgi:TolA-binding protein
MALRRGLLASFVLAGTLVLAALAALYLFRADLRPKDTALGVQDLRPKRGQAQAPVAPVTEKPARAPRSKVLSWDGLSVRPCTAEIRLDPLVRPVLGRLDQTLLDAVKDLKDASGLFPVSDDRVVFEPISRKEASFKEPYAVLQEREGVRVELPMEPIVLDWWPARTVMASALAEAVLIQAAPRYAEAPSWLRHGMALYLSKFGDAFAARTILESSLPPPQLVRALDEAGNLAWTDGYWAVRALSARSGDEAVKRWAQEMFEGRPWAEALQTAAGETRQDFEAKYRSWTTAQLRDLCANRQDLTEAVALLRLQRESEAIPGLEAFVRNRPLDLYAGDARYYLGYARFREGDYREATNGLTDLLVNAPASTTMQGKAHYFLGRCYQLSGYRPLAVKEYMAAAIDPDSPLLQRLAREHLAEVQ